MIRLIGLVTMVFWAVTAYALPARIAALNFSGGQGEGVTIDVSGSPKYRYFTLQNPSRLVVDLFDTLPVGALTQPAVDHPLALAVRTAVRNDHDVRIVVELKNAVEAHAAALSTATGLQIKIGLTAKASTNSAASAGQSVKPVKMPTLAAAEKADGRSGEGKARIKAEPEVLATQSAPRKTARSSGKGRDIVIAIDPGHGGKDIGAQGPGGTQEKDVVFAIAKRLESAVNRQPGMKAVMIRNGDYFVKLRERVNIAERAKADLLISIHADAFEDTSAHGASVYTLAEKGASSSVARYLAASENAADMAEGNGVHDETLASVLADLSHKAAKDASQHVGNRVLRSVKGVGHLHRSSVQKAGFVVLKSPIPSVLIETAFISNPAEEKRLNSRAYQDQMANAVFSGIMAHFKRYAPADTLFAQLQKSGAIRLASRGSDNAETVARRDVAAKSAAKAVRHVASRGETLAGIARQYGVSARELRHVNALGADDVRVGQVLTIPQAI
ncbi:MAG: N-acetylmuramoyl-L-alanine amidase [Methylomonas sp.]|nr:N-acetylmuramoyl-L-alanine amidase [Methylomonas sp.]PPD22090.1 MAG: cell wall hydrolase [Methylomonas sp.]PPD25502.1 MAG: cell wall hydrolase [Methylomonas sp.]PPD36298.1 MAG: cell wall hydrolase [Methylomonas sp.]PPD42423.1 MAG: cell wall hydrolase [Methylomonas sp.]